MKKILLLLLLFISSNCFAATVERYVDPDATGSADGTSWTDAYTSLNTWESSEQTNLVSDGDIHIVHCKSSSGTADTTTLNITGWTTNSTHYIKIVVDPADRHPGYWDTSKYRLDSGSYGDEILDVREGWVRIEGLQFTNTGEYTQLLYSSADNTNDECWVSKCILRGTGSTTQNARGLRITTGYGRMKAWNNLFVDLSNTSYGAGIFIEGTNSHWFYNNTFDHCYIGIDRDNGTITVKNGLFSGCTTDATGTITDTYCATTNDNTKGLTAAGTGNRFSQTFTFNNEAGNDFHLTSGDAGAKDHGTDLSADANLAFSDDIDGDTRSGTWDIGMDEVTGAAPSAPPAQMIFMRF